MTVDPLDQTKAESIRPNALTAGTQIGGYRLIDVLGEGGMGVVWSAHDPDLERTVAIKVLRAARAAASLRMRLLREAQAMARLKHPNVLTVYEVGTEGDRDFIAMELVDGGSLDRWLTTDPPRELVMAAVIAAGRGLAAAHAAGIVHRDFKPHNILRSHDGRVLVTDFGLARGLDDAGGEAMVASFDTTPTPPSAALDETVDVSPSPSASPRASASPSSSSRRDNVLHSPLTQTGALIGTPAYMAPEQYIGSEPDPRTDQFAFCITAWQALTGARPFTGTTMEELRRSAAAGVPKTLIAKLPRAVRAALVRGLHPDREKRWPNLEALLDALEHAERPRRAGRIAAIGAIAVAGTLGIVMLARRSDLAATTAPASACEPAEQLLAEAWSPKLRAALAGRLPVPEPVFAPIADTLDRYRAHWIESYDAACKVPSAPAFHARLGCLLGARDQLAAASAILGRSTVPGDDAFDAPGMLPHPSICIGAVPVTTPTLPVDRAARERAIDAIATTFTLREHALPVLEATVTRLDAEAKAIGWPPLGPRLHVMLGAEYLRRGSIDRARELWNDAIPSAGQARDPTTAATARLGLLEIALTSLEHPGQPGKAKGKGKLAAPLHDELKRLISYARSAVRAAGDDPALAGIADLLEAQALAGAGQWNRYKQPYRDALALTASARKLFELAGDTRRLALAARLEASIDLARGDERALDDAMFAARSASDALDRAHLRPLPAVDEIRGVVAFARGDYREAHARYDALAGPQTPSALPTHTGRVTDHAGAPRSHAVVVAWTGELHGDPGGFFTDRRRVPGDVVEVEADGTFSIHAAPGALVMAQFGDDRSMPQVIGAEPTVLRLEPSAVLAGTIAGRNVFGVRAFARIAVGGSSWYVEAPVERDLTFHLGGVPRGAHVVTGTIGPAGTGTRRVTAGPNATKLSWPVGRAVELIWRSKLDATAATAWLFRGRITGTTRTEIEALAATASDVATGPLRPIGADNTEAGRDLYEAGDLHAVFSGNPDGLVTACVAEAAAATSPVVCSPVEVKGGVVMDYADGRYATDTTPIVLGPAP